MSYGYIGKILHVHLADSRFEVETPPEDFYRKYMGGSAMGMHYLFKHTPAHADPLGPENTLVFSTGVVTGAPVSGQSRLTATAKSPLTDGVGDSQSGGFFPAELKFAGFDALVIHGQASEAVYLSIKDGQPELRPAAHLLGRDTAEVDDLIKAELDDKRYQVLQTGLAGENGVRFAALMTMANRAHGRNGLGAVMAAKNLKAIAVRGSSKRLPVADSKGLNEIARWGSQNFPDSDIFGMGVHGTAEVLGYQNEAGGLPTRNWESGAFDGWEAIDGPTMTERILKERDTCYACTVRCKRVVEVLEGPFQSEARYGGPEYETLSTFGSYCGVDNLEAIATANQLCNQYGMDTISCGATIAWAMDCFEHGLLTAEDTGGIELRYGDAAAMVRMVTMIARREGFGDVLAEGSARAAEKLGVGQDLVVTTKKQEMPAHMPQTKRSLGLIYAVNPFGADHQSSEHDGSYGDYPERMAQIGLTDGDKADGLNREKVQFALTTQYLYSALDSVSVCQFVYGPSWHLMDAEQLAEMTSKVTGWDVTVEELLEVGKRRLNMLQVFNAREGFTRADDILPKKLYQPLKGGASDGVHLTEQELETAKDIYYEMAGWDVESGTPTAELLAELGLDWI
ncbi:MAG: aldehyde ferredoxin oxidoreductase family protein [Chloroflexi bacterium]|jgi:aldehyde:ferredoxin oxidoreductase|nr:aldehyde ferredoxin oxidoreductase family protein [Chloroflexota bacterium]